MASPSLQFLYWLIEFVKLSGVLACFLTFLFIIFGFLAHRQNLNEAINDRDSKKPL